MSAPRKALNLQSVKVRSVQRLTTSIEPITVRQAVTNVVKPVRGRYQAATQVKVLSSEIANIVEADVIHVTESSMKDNALVSYSSLYRSLSPWHGMKRKLSELGRSSVFLQRYAVTSQKRQGVANDTEEVGLSDSTRSLGKLSTWGSGQRYSDGLSPCLIDPQRLS